MKGDGEVGRGRRVVCHLGLGFGFNFGSINAARLGRRMICGYNACCGWNKYILKFRRDPPSPFSLSSVPVCRWHLGFIDFCGWLLWGKHGVGRLSFSLSLDSSWGVFNWLRFWFGSLCFSFLGVPTPRHMQLSAHVCSCRFLPRMGHLCDVPCKILQLLASERARSNFDASLTRVDSRAGILAPLGRYFMWWGKGREVLLPTLCSSRALAFGVGFAVSAASLLPYFVVLVRFCFCVCLLFVFCSWFLSVCVCECVFILAIKCMRRMALMAALGSWLSCCHVACRILSVIMSDAFSALTRLKP